MLPPFELQVNLAAAWSRFRFPLSLNFRIKELSRLAFSLSVRPGSECTTAGAWILCLCRNTSEPQQGNHGPIEFYLRIGPTGGLQRLPAWFSLGSSPDQRCPCVPGLFPASSQFGSLILHPLCPLRGSPFLFLQPLPRCGPRHSFASILHHLRGPFPFSFLLFLASFLPFRDSGLCRSFTGSTRSARR